MDRKNILKDGRQLKAGRVIAGLTVRGMAEKAGVNKNTVLRVESQKVVPYFSYAADRITAVLEEMGISFDVDEKSFSITFSRVL